MRERGYRLQSMVTAATLGMMLIAGWWAWDIGAGPGRVQHDGQALSGILELIVDHAIPALAVRSGQVPPLGSDTIADVISHTLLGARFSDHAGLLQAAIPALTLMSPPAATTPVPPRPEPPNPPPVVDEPGLEPTPIPLRPPQPPVTDDPIVFVYHAHAREAYMPDQLRAGQVKFSDTHSDNPAVTVLAVGQELTAELNRLGVATVQSRELHDRQGRLGAYAEAERTLSATLSNNPGLVLLLDVHRDAQRYPMTAITVNGKAYARVMIVLGQDHPGWRQNYEFACRLLDRLELAVPGISRGILPKASRYNQHMSPGALLLEVGGPENSLAEAFLTARVLARVIADMSAAGDLPPYDDWTLSAREEP